MTAAAMPRGLEEARLYLCTDARQATGDLPAFLDAVLANGVDIVQLRQKGMEAGDELAALEVFADACRRHGALLAVNDRADVAVAAGADVLHLGQNDLPLGVARRLCGSRTLLGRSTHSVAQMEEAAQDGDVDYFCVGPTWTTPTKPGRPAAGLDLVRTTAERAPDKPWFAIGGIDGPERLEQVVDAGARRVVVVRAVTEADDPGEAARTLRAFLTR